MCIENKRGLTTHLDDYNDGVEYDDSDDDGGDGGEGDVDGANQS